MDTIDERHPQLAAHKTIEWLCVLVAGGILSITFVLALSETVLFPGAIFRHAIKVSQQSMGVPQEPSRTAIAPTTADVLAEKALLEAQQRNSLRATLLNRVRLAEDGLRSLKGADSDFRAAFANAAGVPIEAKQLPSLINEQLLKHEAFLHSWDAAHQAVIPAKDLVEQTEALSVLRSRVSDGTFLEADVGAADNVCAWVTGKHKLIVDQEQNLDNISVALKAARFEAAGNH